MYNNESFDDYIRSILGYQNMNNMYIQNNSNNYNLSNNNNREELENCYPEIYKIVYPMISQRCSTMSQPVTRETVENITDEIYSAIEVNSEINLNINLQNKTTGNRQENKVSTSNILKSEDKNEKRIKNLLFLRKSIAFFPPCRYDVYIIFHHNCISPAHTILGGFQYEI